MGAINNIFDEYHQQIFLLPNVSTPFGQNVLKAIENVFYYGLDQLLPVNKMGLVQVRSNYIEDFNMNFICVLVSALWRQIHFAADIGSTPIHSECFAKSLSNLSLQVRF